VDDAAKAEVSAEALAAAREMGQRALAERLRDIDMGAAEWTAYENYLARVAPHVKRPKTSLKTFVFSFFLSLISAYQHTQIIPQPCFIFLYR